jgi:hypothetical protein
VPNDHLVRAIACVLDRPESILTRVVLSPDRLALNYPELMIRMLIIGFVFAIRSEQALCRDVQVSLAVVLWALDRGQGSGSFGVLAYAQQRSGPPALPPAPTIRVGP